MAFIQDQTVDEPGQPLVRAVVLLSVLGTALLALAGRADVLLYGDEHLSIGDLQLGWKELLATYDKRGTGVGFLVLQRLAVDLLGAGPTTYRLPAMLGAVAGVALVHPTLRRSLGSWPALLATPLLAATSLFVHYSRFGRAYALLVPLALIYVGSITQLVEERDLRRRTLAAAALAGGLLPWFHLTSLSVVGLVGLGAVVLALVRRQRDRAVRVAVALVAATLVAACLTLPAWSNMREFATLKVGKGMADFSAPDVAALVLGTRAAGWFAIVALPLAALFALVTRRGAALGVVLAAAAPIIGLALAQPTGGVYAYARYLLLGVPFAAALVALLLFAACRRLPLPPRVRPLSAFLLGLAPAALALAVSPVYRDPAAGGPFSNTNLALLRLPVFDAPFDQTPDFYRELARSPEPRRIVEVPEQVSRSALLYRNYWLTHRHEVVMGFLIARAEANVPEGPYAHIGVDDLRALDADYLVFHREIRLELMSYLNFVGQRVSEQASDALRPYQTSQGNSWRRFENRELDPSAFEVLGEPAYRDRFLTVWKLR